MTGSRRAGAAGKRTDRKRRHRRSSRVRGAVVSTLSLLVLLTSGAGWVYFQLGGDIDTFGTNGLNGERPGTGAGGQNVLVIGSDARTDGNSALGGGSKDDVGRSDTAFLLHVHGDGRNAVAVSFPRDSLVDIPKCRLPDGSWARPQSGAVFNAAFSVGRTPKGNPACTQNTVEKLTGLRVDHTVVVDFKGFSRMTTALGGVGVCLPGNVYEGDLDPNRGTRGDLLFPKGKQTVSGQKALDYVRIRHGLGDGSDIGRIKRQQAFVGSLVKKIKSQGVDPTTLLPLAKAVTESTTVDEGLGTPGKLVDFAMSLKHIELEDTRFVTVPWRYQGNRVGIVRAEADKLWADLRADRPLGRSSRGKGTEHPSPSPGSSVAGKGVSVSVLNGTTTPGLAASAGEELREHGFSVTGSANAASQDRATTVISYGSGEHGRAQELATLFPGAGIERSGKSGLVLTLGSDYDPRSSPGSTSGKGNAESGGRSAADNPCSDLSYG